MKNGKPIVKLRLIKTSVGQDWEWLKLPLVKITIG